MVQLVVKKPAPSDEAPWTRDEFESKLRAADVQVATLQARVAEAEAKLADAKAAGSSEADAMKAERDAAFEALEGFVEKVESLAG